MRLQNPKPKLSQSTPKSFEENYLALEKVLFAQLTNWFGTLSHLASEYEEISLVGPRRNSLESKICYKKNCSTKKVLKTFQGLDNRDYQRQFVLDVMVPLIGDNPGLLKCESIFLKDKV